MIRIDTISGDGMRAINHSAILDFIRRKGPTRAPPFPMNFTSACPP